MIVQEENTAGGGARRAVGALVDSSGRRPLVVLFIALVALVGTWHFALKVLANPHTDLRELLPRDSPGLKAFEHQLGRVGGGATLLVIAESPDRSQNERFIDDLSHRLEGAMAGAAARGQPRLISYVEAGSKDVHDFFHQNKWLYADQKDLEQAYDTLDFQIAVRSGMVSDLDDDSPAQAGAAADGGAQAGAAPSSDAKKPALGLDEYSDRWNAKARAHDDFPSGYFETADGTMIGLRIVSLTTGMGDSAGDVLLKRVGALVDAMRPASYAPAMRVGFAGDIPNAAAEKDSIVSEAVWATGIAFVFIVVGIVWFFRSAWALAIIALPAVLGVGAAYMFAYFAFGYVNTTGMFLGAIIVGNGINYPIVLLARYREFRARGQAPAEARREAVQNALRAELVGACVASIAYGSLTVTQFRGFSQFGWIGLFGMLLVWISMIHIVPALIVLIEGLQSKLPAILRDGTPRVRADGSRGWVTRAIASATERAPWAFVTAAIALTAALATRVPSFLRDPWEYDFDKLGSRGSKHGGAGEWSNKAEIVFGGKMNVAGALMLADTPEEVPLVKAQILANDAADPKGRLIADIATVDDLLPGTVEEQKKKLGVLDRIRDRLTPAVLDSLPPDERARVNALRPPESLHVLVPRELPLLLRRRFEENDGRVGTVFYVKYRNDVVLSDGHNLLRLAKDTDNVRLPGGVVVQTASRSTIFAEMIRSMERDGPRATMVSFAAVALVVLIATRDLRGALAVLAALIMSVTWLVGGAALLGEKLNYVNFITLPITFGIGCEYPFNVYDRSRLLGGDVSSAVRRVGGAVALCSYTTVVGYGSLLFADFQALQSFGRLAVSGEIACLSGALLMLPALLHCIGRRRPRSLPPAPLLE
ncbi:MAG: efflux RND transporter permease subunit [Polyangiaceae bacterium]